MTKRAILVMTYGSPESYTFDGIKKFFTNIRSGRQVSDEEVAHLLSSYQKIKSSPLQEISKKTVDLLQKEIGNQYKIYFANKFSSPYISDVIKQMETEQVEEALCLILEPHYSIYSIMGYEKFLESKTIKFHLIKSWYEAEDLNHYWTEEINRIIKDLDDYQIIFTAHSVPKIALDYGDPYIKQINHNIDIIIKKLGIDENKTARAWQSESNIGLEWVKPDVLDYIKAAKNHPKHYVFVPISFISDHIETLFDNDIECRELCENYGISYHRPPSPNYDNRLIKALVSVIKDNINKEYVYLYGKAATFDEMKSPKDNIKMPKFVEKMLIKKGIDPKTAKMPEHIRKMLERAGKL